MKKIHKRKNLLWRHVKAPLNSIIGLLALKFVKKKNDEPNWYSDINNKEVLIVGTGPSLDRINSHFFESFDSLIYLNYSIKFIKNSDQSFFFSTDPDLVRRLCLPKYYTNLKQIKKQNRIIAPIFLQQVPILDRDFLSFFEWIAPHRIKLEVPMATLLKFKNIKVKVPLPPRFTPADITTDALEAWWRSSSQVSSFPIASSTSAISAILFAAKFNPKKITLIGCDFGEGRVSSLLDDLQPSGKDQFSGAREKFNLVQSFLSMQNIIVVNESWENE